MNIKHVEIWLANLNSTRGSEQAGIRPVLVFQNGLLITLENLNKLDYIK